MNPSNSERPTGATAGLSETRTISHGCVPLKVHHGPPVRESIWATGVGVVPPTTTANSSDEVMVVFLTKDTAIHLWERIPEAHAEYSRCPHCRELIALVVDL